MGTVIPHGRYLALTMKKRMGQIIPEGKDVRIAGLNVTNLLPKPTASVGFTPEK